MIVRRTTAPIRFITRGSLLSLCLLTFVVCDARPAWATCGDYLHGHGSSAAKHDDMNVGMPLGGQDHSPTQVPKLRGRNVSEISKLRLLRRRRFQFRYPVMPF